MDVRLAGSARLPEPRTEDSGIVALLAAGIPLTLLLDLALPDPHSQELYEMERAG